MREADTLTPAIEDLNLVTRDAMVARQQNPSVAGMNSLITRIDRAMQKVDAEIERLMATATYAEAQALVAKRNELSTKIQAATQASQTGDSARRTFKSTEVI